MVKFEGKVIRDDSGGHYFDYSFDLETGGPRKACAGWSLDLIRGKPSEGYHNALPGNEPMAWGYDGRGAELLSISLLANSLKEDWLYYDEIEDAHDHPKRGLILKRYKQFATEIVANLPDEWTMTSDEVLAWLKKKEGNEV